MKELEVYIIPEDLSKISARVMDDVLGSGR